MGAIILKFNLNNKYIKAGATALAVIVLALLFNYRLEHKKEYEQLEHDITALEAEKTEIVAALSSGTLSVEQITTHSKRLPLLDAELDEKSLRWLELSEIAEG